jgi:hypothetical protein
VKHCQILTQADFLLWGFLKESVYSHNPKNLEDIKHKTEQTVTDTNRKLFQKLQKPCKRGNCLSSKRCRHFGINTNYIFVSHSWCLRKNKNEYKSLTLLGCFDMIDIIIITYFISYMFRPSLGQHQGRNMSNIK